MTKLQLSFLLLAASVCCCLMSAGPATALSHVVGGSLGWTIPPNQTYFQDWAKQRVFRVGDQLVFKFTMSLHTVVDVGKDDFDGCTRNKVIDIYPLAPLILNLTAPGDRYFYSGVGMQCQLGQKLCITVIGRRKGLVRPDSSILI